MDNRLGFVLGSADRRLSANGPREEGAGDRVEVGGAGTRRSRSKSAGNDGGQNGD
jgi:hypothetical protein